MEVLVSNRFIVTFCSTVFVTVMVVTDITVGDSVFFLVCVGLMHVVVSCAVTKNSGKCRQKAV